MSLESIAEHSTEAVRILPILKQDLEAWLASQSEPHRGWVRASRFSAEAWQICRIPTEPAIILFGLGESEDRWSYSSLPLSLPEGLYTLDREWDEAGATRSALSWAVGAHQFTRYKSAKRQAARLCWPRNANRDAVVRDARAIALVRDLINTPANDLGPAELADIARNIALRFGGHCEVTVGEDLISANYPLIHAVGKASERAPRLIDMQWGDLEAPKLTLVGKGVCFDSGGLNLKARGPMSIMKLDMGGAAHVLALAQMIMESELPVRLRVLIPAVENAIGGAAIRPRDVVPSRKGMTVEIGDTDAEGRLILADALYEGAREEPDLLVDIATLTGSARVALGTDITALFTDNDALAHRLESCSKKTDDPIWRLPLWRPYDKDLEGKIADLTNVADLNLGPTTFAGAIYAALFLARFVEPLENWLHLDICGWNLRARPGRPEGGDVFAILALFALLCERYQGGMREGRMK